MHRDSLGVALIRPLEAGAVVGGRFELEERTSFIGLSTHADELPWNDVWMLRAPEVESFGVVLAIPQQVKAWSEYYTSAFYVSDCAGRGANGEVWRGFTIDNFERTNVVLKRVYSGKGSPAIASFMREIYFGSTIGRNLQHLSRFITHFVENGDLWMVFHDEGISLYQAIFQPTVIGELSIMTRSSFWSELRAKPDLVVRIMRQVLEGLVELHSANITHRDIKLENILIDPATMHVRIADLGSAYPTDNVELMESLFPPHGPTVNEETHRYSPPEAVHDSESSIVYRDASFDIWGVGVLWLELIMGTTDLGIGERQRDGLCVLDADCRGTKFRDRIRKRDPLGTGVTDDMTFDLISQLLSHDPAVRPTAKDALEHPALNPDIGNEAPATQWNVAARSHSSQGGRTQMEDRWISQWVGSDWYLACVLDGHNGFEVAEYNQQQFVEIIISAIHKGRRPDELLKESVATLVSESEEQDFDAMAGSTLCCALISRKTGDVWVANVGDSRLISVETVAESEWVPAVGGRVTFGNPPRTGKVSEIRGKAVIVTPDDQPDKKTVGKDVHALRDPVSVTQVTVDHKPDLPSEEQFIESHGGTVSGTTARVNGILAVSRSIGAAGLKPYVRSEPDIFHITSSTSRKLILATDGVWDVLSNQEVGEISDPAAVIQQATEAGARDNMVVLLVDITRDADGEGQCSASDP